MAKKDLIIGAFTNYNFNQLKPWVESIEECGFKGDKLMIMGNYSQETHDELEALSDDIFRYFGLGCRNVSKLFIPNSYDFKTFFKSVYKWHPIIHQSKYANNYDYNKAVYLMSEFNLLENGFLMLKEDTHYGSPIATLFYEFYELLLRKKVIFQVNLKKRLSPHFQTFLYTLD